MAKRSYKYYSAYNRHTDLPVFVHGTAAEVGAAIGLTVGSVYIYVTRTRKNEKKGKYEIYVDDSEEDDDG